MGLFSFFLFCFLHAHKKANKRISCYFPLRYFLSAFFIFICLLRFLLLLGCVFMLFVLFVPLVVLLLFVLLEGAESFSKKITKGLKLP